MSTIYKRRWMKRYHENRRRPVKRKPCAVPECDKPTRSIGSLCCQHNKHEARTGSAYHSGLTRTQCKAYKSAAYRVLRDLLNAKHWPTTLMVKECIACIHALPRVTPRLHEMGRMAPIIKAQAILFHVHRQYVERGKQRKKSEVTFALSLLSSMISRELVAPSICSAPMYVKTQACHAVHSRLLKVEVKRFSVENGRGGFVESVVVHRRPQLQSKSVVRRLYAMVEPTYRIWLDQHQDTIRATVEERQGIQHLFTHSVCSLENLGP